MKEVTPEPDFPVIKQETLDKLASRDKELRDSGALDIFEQFLPAIPPEYIFKNRDRQFVADTMHVAFDLNGGVARLAKYANENYGDFIKLYAKLIPEAEKKESGPAVVQVFHNVPASALDTGDLVDMDDDESEDADE